MGDRADSVNVSVSGSVPDSEKVFPDSVLSRVQDRESVKDSDKLRELESVGGIDLDSVGRIDSEKVIETDGDIVPETEAETEKENVGEGDSDSVFLELDLVGGGDMVPVFPVSVSERDMVSVSDQVSDLDFVGTGVRE